MSKFERTVKGAFLLGFLACAVLSWFIVMIVELFR